MKAVISKRKSFFLKMVFADVLSSVGVLCRIVVQDYNLQKTTSKQISDNTNYFDDRSFEQ